MRNSTPPDHDPQCQQGCQNGGQLFLCPLWFSAALLERGLEWDIVGPDWYQDMGSFQKLMDPLKKAFPHHEFLICEANVQSNEDNTHSPLSDWNWLLAGMHYCYNEERIIGFIYYELLDELYFLDDQNIEAREALSALSPVRGTGPSASRSPSFMRCSGCWAAIRM